MITIGIATLPEREAQFKQVITSLYPQCNRIIAVLNNYTHTPEWIKKFPNMETIIADNSLGDAAKFLKVEECEGYYISWDDDLLAPSGAMKYIISGVNRYNGVAGLHGKTYPRPFVGFKKWNGNYRCLGDVRVDVHVDLIGSGCCGFHADRLKLSLSDFPTANMADCYLSRAAHVQGVPMVVLKHSQAYIKYLTPPGDTIWRSTADHTLHNEVLKSYLK